MPNVIKKVRVTKISTLPDKHAYDEPGTVVLGELRDEPRKSSLFILWKPTSEKGKPLTRSENSTWNTSQIQKITSTASGGEFTTEDSVYRYEVISVLSANAGPSGVEEEDLTPKREAPPLSVDAGSLPAEIVEEPSTEEPVVGPLPPLVEPPAGSEKMVKDSSDEEKPPVPRKIVE